MRPRRISSHHETESRHMPGRLRRRGEKSEINFRRHWGALTGEIPFAIRQNCSSESSQVLGYTPSVCRCDLDSECWSISTHREVCAALAQDASETLARPP